MNILSMKTDRWREKKKMCIYTHTYIQLGLNYLFVYIHRDNHI